MLQAGLARLGKRPPEPAVQRWLGQFRQSSGTAGAPGRSAWIYYAKAPCCRAGPARRSSPPARATAVLTERASVWDGPGSGQRAGFAQAALETAFLLPATIPPFL